MGSRAFMSEPALRTRSLILTLLLALSGRLLVKDRLLPGAVGRSRRQKRADQVVLRKPLVDQVLAVPSCQSVDAGEHLGHEPPPLVVVVDRQHAPDGHPTPERGGDDDEENQPAPLGNLFKKFLIK